MPEFLEIVQDKILQLLSLPLSRGKETEQMCFRCHPPFVSGLFDSATKVQSPTPVGKLLNFATCILQSPWKAWRIRGGSTPRASWRHVHNCCLICSFPSSKTSWRKLETQVAQGEAVNQSSGTKFKTTISQEYPHLRELPLLRAYFKAWVCRLSQW